MEWTTAIFDLLWRNAVVVVPLVLLVVVTTRLLPCKPTTRHLLWTMLLAWIVLPPVLPGAIAPEAGEQALLVHEAPVTPGDQVSVMIGRAAAPNAIRTPTPKERPQTAASPRIGRAAVPDRKGAGRVDASESALIPTARSAPVGEAAATPLIRGPVALESDEDCVRPRPAGAAPRLLRAEPVDRGGDRAPYIAAKRGRAAKTSATGFVPPSSSLCIDDPDTTARTKSQSPRRLVPAVGSRGLLSYSKRLSAAEKSVPVESSALPDGTPVRIDAYVVGAVGNFVGQAAPASVPPSQVDNADHQARAAPISVEAPAPERNWDYESAVQLVSAWVGGFAMIRDTIVALPRMPDAVWIGGAALLVLWLSLRIVADLWRLRHAVAAPRDVRAAVRRVSRRMGLRRPPRTFLFEGRMGPMILCGRETRLMLPRQLWGQLNETAREVILCHELAHIKRRDHWICRAELVVAALFWWHPLVWWIRHRLHEEAEFCCDAWVTWLMPYDRRAYAEALLHTKSYVVNCNDAVPLVGIGVTSGRAKRFARRITMVMTGSVRPRMSGAGMALAASLAVVGWLASPAQSCPQEGAKAKAGSRVTARVQAGCATCAKGKPCGDCKVAVRVCSCDHCRECTECRGAGAKRCCDRAGCVAKECVKSGCDKKGCCGLGRASVGGKSTFEQHLSQRDLVEAELAAAGTALNAAKGLGYAVLGQHRGDRDDLEERMERLERRLEELMERLDDGGRRGREPRRPRAPRPPRRPEPPTPPSPPSPDGQMTRAYELPGGKLEALTKLMVRSDVPVLVRPGESKIEVIGTPGQHARFKAFVDLVNGSKERAQVAYELPEGKLDAIVELMIRDDVPVLVSPRDDSIVVHGNGVEQAIFQAFVDMIHPRSGHTSRFFPAPDVKVQRRVEADAQRRTRRMEREAVKQERKLERKLRKERKEKREKVHRHGHRLRTELDKEELHELLSQVAEELGEDRTRLLIELSHGPATQDAEHVRHEANALSERAIMLASEVNGIEEQADALHEHAESIEEQAEELAGRAQELEEVAQELRERPDQDEDADSEAESLVREAKTLEHEAATLEREAETIEREADAMQGQAERMEEQSEALSTLADFLLQTLQKLDAEYARPKGT